LELYFTQKVVFSLSTMKRIHLPHPCEADASVMSPTERGSFCSQCQKEVVDFSRMNDGEIADFLQAQSDKTCGKFRKDQLNRTLVLPAPRHKNRFVAAGLSLLALTAPALGFAQQTPAEQVQRSHSRELRIRLIHAETGEPLTYLGSVKLEGSPMTFGLDSKGIIRIAESQFGKQETIQLTCSHPGFKDITVVLPSGKLEKEYTFALTPVPQDFPLSGTVWDSHTQEPLQGATIRIMQNGVIKGGAYTDLEGKFKARIPASILTKPAQMMVSFVFYETDTLDISHATKGDIRIELVPYDKDTEEVIVIAGMIEMDERPHNRIKRFFGRIRRRFR